MCDRKKFQANKHISLYISMISSTHGHVDKYHLYYENMKYKQI